MTSVYTVVNLDTGVTVEFTGLPDAYALATRMTMRRDHSIIFAANLFDVHQFFIMGLIPDAPDPRVVWSSRKDSDQMLAQLEDHP